MHLVFIEGNEEGRYVATFTRQCLGAFREIGKYAVIGSYKVTPMVAEIL